MTITITSANSISVASANAMTLSTGETVNVLAGGYILASTGGNAVIANAPSKTYSFNINGMVEGRGAALYMANTDNSSVNIFIGQSGRLISVGNPILIGSTSPGTNCSINNQGESLSLANSAFLKGASGATTLVNSGSILSHSIDAALFINEAGSLTLSNSGRISNAGGLVIDSDNGFDSADTIFNSGFIAVVMACDVSHSMTFRASARGRRRVRQGKWVEGDVLMELWCGRCVTNRGIMRASTGPAWREPGLLSVSCSRSMFHMLSLSKRRRSPCHESRRSDGHPAEPAAASNGSALAIDRNEPHQRHADHPRPSATWAPLWQSPSGRGWGHRNKTKTSLDERTKIE
jgi:hypothetical protein